MAIDLPKDKKNTDTKIFQIKVGTEGHPSTEEDLAKAETAFASLIEIKRKEGYLTVVTPHTISFMQTL